MPQPDRAIKAQYTAGIGVIALLVATALLVLTQLSAAIPLIPPAGAELGTEVTFELSTVFSICYAVGFLIWGPLADQYGHKPILVIGLTLLTLATIATGFATSALMLAVLRGLQGLVAASFAPVALAYLSEAPPPKWRAAAIGAMSTAFLVASIIGQVFAATVARNLGWQAVFIISGVALAVPAMVSLFGETAAPNRASGMAINGFVLFLGASLGSQAATLQISFPMLLLALVALLGIAALSLTGFIHIQRTPETRASA